MSQRQSTLSVFSRCEKLRDEIRQEETGREETRKHFKETVTGVGDSLENRVGEKRNITSQVQGPGVKGALCTRVSVHCKTPNIFPRLSGPIFSSAEAGRVGTVG